SVVQAVREHVDLRVLPANEVAVHPDQFGWIHSAHWRLSRTALLAWAVLASPPRSGVRRPPSSARCTADSTAAASLAKPSPWASITTAHRTTASRLEIAPT